MAGISINIHTIIRYVKISVCVVTSHTVEKVIEMDELDEVNISPAAGK